MIVRHIIFAGLFATASLANAGTTEGDLTTVQAAWTFNAGTDSEPKAFQSSLAGPGGTWSAHSRLGDVGSSSTMLFSQNGSPFSTAPLASTSTASSQPAAAAIVTTSQPAAAAPEVTTAGGTAPVQIDFSETNHGPAAAAIASPAPSEMAAIIVTGEINAPGDSPAAVAAVPEPATGMLMLAGLLGAGCLTRRRK